MKKVIALMGFLALATMGYTQAPKHLQGPRAKNYKPYLKSSPQVGSIAHIQVNPKKPKGPSAKHRKAWAPDDATRYRAAEVRRYTRWTGPGYKNLRPWQEAPKPKILIAKENPPTEQQPAKSIVVP